MKFLGKSNSYQKKFGLILAIGPGCFYRTVFYSESLFFFLTTLLFYIILSEKQNKKSFLTGIKPLKLFCVLVIGAYAGLVRSIGFMYCAVFCYPLLLESIKFLKKFETKLALKSFFLIILSSIVFLLPMVGYSYKQYKTYCKEEQWDNSTVRPTFCYSFIPSFYKYIQIAYWDVYFLSFIKKKEYPLILTAILVIISAIMLIMVYFRENKNIFGWISGNLLIVWKNPEESIWQKKFVYYPHFVIFGLLYFSSLLITNLNSAERFYAAQPFFYILLVEFQLELEKINLGRRFWILEILLKDSLLLYLLIKNNLALLLFVTTKYPI